MDEILIDEKKYVSSKQAAKITGYAKDYIGQLCREGRVPARLVGRSWYVLATAIEDHRFGTSDTQAKEGQRAAQPAPALPWTQESPRYEMPQDEVLPSINRLKDEEESEEVTAPMNLQSSWKAWFDHIGKVIEPAAIFPEPEKQVVEDDQTEEPEVELEEAEDVKIPIRAIYQAPPRELLPHYSSTEEDESEEEVSIDEVEERRSKQRQVGNKFLIRTIRVIAVLLAITSASLAAIGSGYLDNLIASTEQASVISGIQVYNK